VKTLVDGTALPGRHTVFWNRENENGERVASGIYFYQLTTDECTSTKKMIVLK